ncbi:hypothetical protein PAE975_6194 (plasmid) [Pseudomonas aeruginosa]|jgi:hypothetical protein|uniref:hypothetical protein n=1 Tax=Pseudomonas aeruginosa TaxID=287 RepID=UPI001A299DA5|nr:hypothetical protein [Pseudomonas aeruginosa]EKV0397230.1 hypothetical protein [Pseudomonas aeruginosa]EKV3012149.1 hypothetical protein [Pseudomonas aeruginosa]MBH4318554.1 hypothetical protein [Pseudomonas aeruginosa]MBH8701091.1 hypothetical protein [Pseudomonas aeruginosa]WBM10799.1 hypothetical protein M1V28_32780 [Pseudomonas aeruginosa]
MADHQETYAAYGGLASYRGVHEALSRALAEPSAQGNNAHGARAAFLLSEIAPQLLAARSALVIQALEEAGACASMLQDVEALLSSEIAAAPSLPMVSNQ